MKANRAGEFSLYVEAEVLSKGLRPSKRVPRNSKYLVQCSGAVGKDGVLQVIDDLEENRIDTSVITDSFPYPQIFIFPSFTMICGKTKIYEYVSSLTLKHTAAAGTLWSVAEFFQYVYMSNGVESVIRDSGSGVYSITTDLPISTALCNYNGQVFAGMTVPS